MSQTSQTHAHCRGMDISRNTPPGGLVGASPEAVGWSRSSLSGASTAAREEKMVGLGVGLYTPLATLARRFQWSDQTEG